MATSILIPWLLFAAAVAVAIVGLSRLRAAAGEVAQRDARISELEGALEAGRKETDKATAKLRKVSDELEQARRRVEKSRKRSEREDGSTRRGTATAASEPEGAIEAVRQERDAARQHSTALAEELAKAHEKIAATAANKPLLDNAAIAALETRTREAEQAAEKVRAELAEQRAQGDRVRKKFDTQQLLYTSIRSELAAKKDRLRTQTEELERLRAIKVAVANDPD